MVRTTTRAPSSIVASNRRHAIAGTVDGNDESALTPNRMNTIDRRLLATANAREAAAAMSECRLCAHDCGADRSRAPAGQCQAGARARVFHTGVEWVGEAQLVPTFCISLSGCNVSCAFCLTGEDSQDTSRGDSLALDRIGALVAAMEPQLESVTILGGEPSVHLASALEVAATIPNSLPIVWKTNAYASPSARALLTGVVDVVLADLEFGNDDCAERLAGRPDYDENMTVNLAWATGEAGLVVRHLLMPGHVDCCTLPLLDRLAARHPNAPLSLIGGFVPAHHTHEHTELARTHRAAELNQARRAARVRGLRLAPWRAVREPKDDFRRFDEVWVDRQGRVLVDSASAELVRCLDDLGPALA